MASLDAMDMSQSNPELEGQGGVLQSVGWAKSFWTLLND